jgi:pyruvate dehydrogenase E1 component alpha subunit
MHIADVDRGMLGANGIVGGGPPLACGAALSGRLRGSRQATACFFGDGGANQGTTAESLNLAAVWKLPVVFICENNRYAETTSTDYSIGGPDIAGRGTAFGMPGIVVDGQDVFAVYEAAGEALKRARDGHGPTLLECQTYRYFGHFEGDELKYRTRDEEAYYRERDCLEQFRSVVLDGNLLEADQLDAIDREAEATIAEAVAFAESSPLPDPADCLEDVYVSY